MDLVDSIPITDIDPESVRLEMGGHYSYYGEPVRFNITDVNLTELDNKRNPVITRIARKKKVNVTVSGHFTEHFKISSNCIKPDIDRPDVKQVDIKDKVFNITFYGIRIIREKIWNDSSQSVITVPKLMVDNTHELYGFLKPIYVNKGEMSVLSEKNIYLTFNELGELLKDITVNLGVTDISDSVSTVYYWITEYKKGDSNGDKTH